ncbi:GNAT family N-acetyltransferase [Aquimarina sp. 433]
MEISFTTYTVKDKAEVLEMMAAFNKMEGYAFDSINREKNLLEFTSNGSLGRLYLIKLQQQTIGYLVLAFGFSFEYKGRDAFIDEFYIKPAYRNKGIGDLTLDFIASESKKLEVKALHLEVEPHNVHANKLYLSKGYRSNDRKLMTKRI